MAVKVTDWPKTDGLDDDVTTAVLPSWLTVSERTDEVLAANDAFPL